MLTVAGVMHILQRPLGIQLFTLFYILTSDLTSEVISGTKGHVLKWQSDRAVHETHDTYLDFFSVHL